MNNLVFIPPLLRERAEKYCDIMQKIAGVDPLEDTRHRPVVIARTMVANALLQDGYTLHAVGTILGVDHATVNHYRKRFQDIESTPGYEAEREIWNRFKRRIWSL